MADEYAQNLPDIPERTATADTDLVLVNSGGKDYKQTKANFLRGNLHIIFSNTSTLTSQVDALAVGHYEGICNSYGHQSETGVPVNASVYVVADVYGSANATIRITLASATPNEYIIAKAPNSWGEWIQLPTRAEISALNNSLTQSSLKFADHSFTNITIASTGYAKLGSIPTDFGVSISNFFVGFIVRGWSGGNGGAISIALGSNGTDVYILGVPNSIVQNINVRLWYVQSASN